MGRPGLTKNRKFPRLARALEPACRAFSEQVARGALELLWDSAYENGDDYVGDASDVEAASHWKGKPGVLARALLEAGGEGEIGFIEEVPERPGHYFIHDLYDHAPKYVKARMEREAERVAKGKTISDVRRSAASSRWKKKDANGCKRDSLAPATPTHADANGTTPSPAPAPAPSPILEACSEASSEPPAAVVVPASREGNTPAPKPEASPSLLLSPVVLTLPCVGAGPAEFRVTQDMVDGWVPAFPSVDIPAQLQRMRVYFEAKPAKRKTHRGMPAAIAWWLGSAQDRGSGGGTGPPARQVTAAAEPARSQTRRVEIVR